MTPEAKTELLEASNYFRHAAERLLAEGGSLEQLERGDLDTELNDSQASDMAAALRALAEHARATRPALSEDAAPHAQAVRLVEAAAGLSGWPGYGLPFNRKERYFTGTVLPALLMADGFAHAGRFLRLAGLPADLVPLGRDGDQELQFFSEYSFAESLTGADKVRFPKAPTDKDTPDLVLCGRDWLLAVEAKVYDVPSKADMVTQMTRQQVLVDYWVERLNIPQERTAHVLLVPASLERVLGMTGGPWPVVTWEQVADAYQPVGPAHFTAVLAVALAHYEDLKSHPLQFGQYKDAGRTGEQIRAAVEAGDTEFTYMGRQGGLHGDDLAQDIASGGWLHRTYEVRREPLDAKNWFPIEEFISRLPE
jgi:hypothetical protein